MYQTIGEKISVAGVYKNAKFIPKKIQWNRKNLEVDQITFIADTKDGGVRRRIYSFMCKGNLYRVSFNRETEVWVLEELWYDG